MSKRRIRQLLAEFKKREGYRPDPYERRRLKKNHAHGVTVAFVPRKYRGA